jgi:hypothetical protein
LPVETTAWYIACDTLGESETPCVKRFHWSLQSSWLQPCLPTLSARRAGNVTVDDLVRVINIALGQAVLSSCDRADVNRDGLITIDELLKSVNAALNGCVA